MGITVGELLSQDYFRNFEVIAGKNGLNREIQGITFWEAPDGFRWATSKELTFTSGYVFAKEQGNLETYKKTFCAQQAGLILKRGRYLDPVPQDMIRVHDEFDVPLILMPFSIPWMEVINQVNVAVMNRAIQRLSSGAFTGMNAHNQNYRERKIQKILRTVELEMEFPAFLYDVFEEKSYYSSDNFQKTSACYGLRDQDYWNPTLPHTAHTLCDCIHMCRYRLYKGELENEPRISWVTIPIEVDGIPQAYFCVMESRKLLDFYDEYSMRIAYLMLQSIYEQISAARDCGNIGFENLVHFALECSEEDTRKVVYQAEQYGIPAGQEYIYVLLHHHHDSCDIRSRRSEMLSLFYQSTTDRFSKLVFLSGSTALILLNAGAAADKQAVLRLLQDFRERLVAKFPGIPWCFAVSFEAQGILSIKAAVHKCEQVLQVGRLIHPGSWLHDYDDLGLLTWLQIPEGELKQLLTRFQKVLEHERSQELISTLKVYLENNMNYSLTAEKLFVNVNTIRRRIERVNEMVDIDWDSYFERVKIGLMLQFLQQ